MHLIFALLLACGTSTPEAPASREPAAAPTAVAATGTAARMADGTMNVQALHERLGKETQLVLDVRTTGEFAQGHVAGAVNIPLQELKSRMSELEPYKGQEIAVICAVGGRSATATGFLQTEGYAQAYNVEGGTRAWVSAGYPVE